MLCFISSSQVAEANLICGWHSTNHWMVSMMAPKECVNVAMKTVNSFFCHHPWPENKQENYDRRKQNISLAFSNFQTSLDLKYSASQVSLCSKKVRSSTESH